MDSLTTKDKTFIIGDTHGDFSSFYDWQMRISARDFNLLHVGDIGIGFPYHKKNYIERLNRQFQRRGIMFYGTRGNHDNPRYWNKGDGAEHIKLSNFELVPDGEVRNIGGKDVLFFGGATSVDRCFRTHGWDWWRNEYPILDIDKLKQHENVDIIVSHGCPSRAIPVTLPSLKGAGIVSRMANEKDEFGELKDPTLIRDLKKELELFDELEEFVLDKWKISHWYFGHYHKAAINIINDISYRCLDIDEITMLK